MSTTTIGAASLPRTRDEAAKRWPRLVAHVICESLGYWCVPGAAGMILDFKKGQQNYSEYVSSCWKGDPSGPLRRAIRCRHTHRGYMASYALAKAIVDRYNRDQAEPNFGLGSWF